MTGERLSPPPAIFSWCLRYSAAATSYGSEALLFQTAQSTVTTLYLSDYVSSVWPKVLTRAVSVAQGSILNNNKIETLTTLTLTLH